MSVPADGNLHIYVVNVGQADTTVIISPEGNLAIIDAARPDKLVRLLDDLGLNTTNTIEHLIITHPHSDHFSGGNRLATDYTIDRATFAPFWHNFGIGPATYRRLIGRLQDAGTRLSFLSGYSRYYLDNVLMPTGGGQDPVVDPNAPFLELLGPTNGLVRQLEAANVFNTNHLTIMSRLSWRNFRMISTGDAQLENWAFFDEERLMEEPCQVLRAAHHGSSNGTQWERINRIEPELVIVSSNPPGGHRLPDMASTAVFTQYDHDDNQMAVITHDTGTIHLEVQNGGNPTVTVFGDNHTNNVNLGGGQALGNTGPTNWIDLLNTRITQL